MALDPKKMKETYDKYHIDEKRDMVISMLKGLQGK